MDFSFLVDWLNSFEAGSTGALLVGAFGYVCSLIGHLLPTPDDDSNSAYKALYNVVNWAGLNFGAGATSSTTETTTTTEES